MGAEPCIYCGAEDHEVVDSVVGFVRLCPRAPDGVPTLSPKVADRMRDTANAIISMSVTEAVSALDGRLLRRGK